MEKCIEKEKKGKVAFLEQSRVPNHRLLSSDKQLTSDRFSKLLAHHAEKFGVRTYCFVQAHWLGIINFHLFLFIGGALLTPCLSCLDLKWMSKIIYGFYSIFCHQKESRSFFFLENQVAICSRCLAFYSSVLILALGLSIKRIKPLNLEMTLILASPAMLDVLLQTLHLKESTNLIRAITGALLGMSVTLWLLPRAQNAMESLTTKKSQAPQKYSEYLKA